MMHAQWVRKLSWMMLGSVFGALIVLGITAGADNSLDVLDATLAEDSEVDAGDLQHLQEQVDTFMEVMRLIKSQYVEPVAEKKLFEYALKGMVSRLDPHSEYLTPEEFRAIQEHTSGEFGGLGMQIGMDKSGFVKVIAPIDDTPAKRAGIKSGDLIIRIDNKPLKNVTLDEAVRQLRGKPGTKVTLTILREGEEKPLTITITRDIIRIKSVKFRMLPDHYGYVRLSTFNLNTAEQMNEAIRKLKAQARKEEGTLHGLVLDLRDNPGGVLDTAVNIADAFLNAGKIVYTKGRTFDARMEFNADNGDVLKGKPIVVLVNEGSASASEIVAGALQDHHRALIAGRKTFGKGSVQTIIPLGNGAALKLTTSRYFTPSGRSIQAEGIVPDAIIPRLKIAKVEDEDLLAVHEADLEGHLSHQDDKPVREKEASEQAEEEKKAIRQLLKKDYELYQGLLLLKSMSLMKQQNN